jgi:tetratricopeptide (TPR) repeat protein
VDQTARIEDGSGNIIVQAVASTVTVGVPPQLKLSPRHRRRRPPKSDIDLLNPFTDGIPFVGREAELARLHDWLVSPQPISARCLIGRAGAGKTRLALQLCERAEALQPECDAGFVEHRELGRFASLQNLSDWGWQRRTLIVVDYAAGITRWLRPWLEELAQNPGREGVPLRLLLLERFADSGIGWWGELTRTGFGDAGIPDLFDPPQPEPLPPIGAGERTRLVRAVMRKAQSENTGNLDADAAGVERLAEQADDATEALDALMAGLTAAKAFDPARRGQPASRVEMAKNLAGHEGRRIRTIASDRGADPQMLFHLAAVTTLMGGVDREEARAMIEAELAALPRGTRSAVELRDILADALPVTDGERIAPILPDLIGEALMLEAFRPLPRKEQDGIIARSSGRAPDATIASVIRTGQDFAEGEDHPAVRWLDGLVERSTTVADLMQLAAAFPHQTLVLRDRAAAITAAIADHLRSATEPESDPAALAQRAVILNNLSNRLSDLGRREEALAAAVESADLYRALAAQRPDAFRPDLAMSLNTLANRLSALGRREEALAAAGEAVDAYRALAAQRPDAFRPDLARSLNNLATMLSDLGRHEEALAAAVESADLYRALVAQRPDAFRPDLARLLSVLGDCREAVGDLDGALRCDCESVACLAPYLVRWPDSYAGLMGAICRDYLRRCEAAGVGPDGDLLAPVIEVFQGMQGGGGADQET